MSLILTASTNEDFTPHPAGIFPAVCLDVVDLGMIPSQFEGVEKRVHKIKIVWETEETLEDGTRCTISKNFTASLHPKATLAKMLGTWRGKPVDEKEAIDLERLINKCCTLAISHQTGPTGKAYASIDAISKPTKAVTPSGKYDPAEMRERMTKWIAKQCGKMSDTVTSAPAAKPVPTTAPAAMDDVPF